MFAHNEKSIINFHCSSESNSLNLSMKLSNKDSDLNKEQNKTFILFMVHVSYELSN